jgi:hypothetical protein
VDPACRGGYAKVESTSEHWPFGDGPVFFAISENSSDVGQSVGYSSFVASSRSLFLPCLRLHSSFASMYSTESGWARCRRPKTISSTRCLCAISCRSSSVRPSSNFLGLVVFAVALWKVARAGEFTVHTFGVMNPFAVGALTSLNSGVSHAKF